MRRILVLAGLTGGALAACGPGVPTPTLGAVEFSGRVGSGEPNPGRTPRAELLLTWFEPAADGSGEVLRLVAATGEGWGEPRTVVAGRDFFVNWADFPSVARQADGTLSVHWLEKVEALPYAYHVMLSRSTDDGETWSAPMTVHDDVSPTEHGFVSMMPGRDGSLALVWLDGRNTRDRSVPGAAMQLRARFLDPAGRPGPEFLLDDRTCDCCQTALVETGDGALLAAWRDRSPEEIRDIAVSRFDGAAWSSPTHVGNDQWHFPACPVNGPALSVQEHEVAIAWFSAPEGDARVQVAFSEDDGRQFGPAIRIDEGSALGRVAAVHLAPDRVLVTWLVRHGTGGSVWARVVSSRGNPEPAWRLFETSPSRRSGFPRLAILGDDVLVAWTEVGDTGGIRVARLSGLVRGKVVVPTD